MAKKPSKKKVEEAKAPQPTSSKKITWNPKVIIGGRADAKGK